MRLTAIIVVTAFSVLCPKCKEVQTAKNGSEFFTPEEVEPGQPMKCQSEECGQDFRLPTTIKGSGK